MNQVRFLEAVLLRKHSGDFSDKCHQEKNEKNKQVDVFYNQSSEFQAARRNYNVFKPLI